MSDTHHALGRDIGSAVAKTLPPAAVWTLTANDWLAVVSILYVLLQAAYLIWKWRRDALQRAADKAAIAALMKRPLARPGQKPPGHG